MKVGWITNAEYDKYHQLFRKKLDDIKNKEGNLQKAEDNYYITASYLLELAVKINNVSFLSKKEILACPKSQNQYPSASCDGRG